MSVFLRFSPGASGLLYLACFLFAASISPCHSQQNVSHLGSDEVASVIAGVNTDSLIRRMNELCGLDEVTIGGVRTRILNRMDGAGDKNNELVGDYLTEVLAYYGLVVESQRFDEHGRNIIGRKEGKSRPQLKYIICAHYDADGYGLPAADDNASGTAGVLEAARILTGYETGCTVEFILFDCEEKWLDGSRYYAGTARASGDSILGVINLDMISWDFNNDRRALMEYNTPAGASLTNMMAVVNRIYHIGLDLYTRFKTNTGSDNYAFTLYGYPSMLLCEDWYNDWCFHIHRPGDTPDKVNQPYFTRLVRLAIGSLASLAGLQGRSYHPDTEPVSPSVSLFTPFPHPVPNDGWLRFSITEKLYVRIELFDTFGRPCLVITDAEFQAGMHHLHLDASRLPQGMYIVRLTTTSEVIQRQIIHTTR